ncbi:ABC transporter permease [Streptomyces sp. O3]
MTALSPPPAPSPSPSPPPSSAPAPPRPAAAPGPLGVWVRDLGMGIRFAVGGGREGWFRTLLTAVGVGLGVTLLLVTTAVPNALQARGDRDAARYDALGFGGEVMTEADDTLLITRVDTYFRDDGVRGRLLRAEGPDAPRPPGVERLPGAGEIVVSPALDKLLKSSEGELLARRLPDRVIGTIGDSGLVGPTELAYYQGSDTLTASPGGHPVARIDGFGEPPAEEAMGPILTLLALVVFVVLLMPVGVFIAAAVRFGGDRRDRRLAALRLVGADSRMARRIAAGEAFAGALLGLLLGAVFFLGAREFASGVELFDRSVFSYDLNPSPVLALLVALAVPAAAVAVTLFALRGVVIEPLGVVRTAKPRQRRLWWRPLLPLAGLALLYPMFGQGDRGGEFSEWMVTAGVVLILVGITALLPWLVEACVRRLDSGGVSWQLAVRRLQLSSGTAATTVNGIAVAVAGAIALQMLFTGVEGDFTERTGADLDRAQMAVSVPQGPDAARQTAEANRRLQGQEGVRGTWPVVSTYLAVRAKDPEDVVQLTVGDCATLRELADLPSCRDGDVFYVPAPEGMDEYDGYPDPAEIAKPGGKVYLEPGYSELPASDVTWTIPAKPLRATGRKAPDGSHSVGMLATPSALPSTADAVMRGAIDIQIDTSVPDAREHVRNAAALTDPQVFAYDYTATTQSGRFASIRTGLFIGAACVMLLIGASLLVSQLEQLRERRKLLSALVAFGTRRRTLCRSVLWQAAIPVGLGLVLSAGVGIGLGAALLAMTSTPVRVDWASVLTMSGIGAGVVLLVTALSLPVLLRLMRPDGLRTE